MADFRAVLAVSEAMRGVLRSAHRREDFDDTQLEFEINTPQQFKSRQIQNGITIFLYRIYINGANRIPAGRMGADCRRQRPLLPLEVHYLVAIWAQKHTLQPSLATWAMRTLEDNALLTAGVLNAGGTTVFRPEEAVELCLAEIRTEDLFRIWDVLGDASYQLSIPYLARVIPVESLVRLSPAEGPPIQDRTFRQGHLETSARRQGRGPRGAIGQLVAMAEERRCRNPFAWLSPIWSCSDSSGLASPSAPTTEARRPACWSSS